jgi:hypothetical protein
MEPFSNLVQESNGCALIAGIVDIQDSDTGAIVDGSELIQPFSRPRDALEELHVHLQAVSRLGLLAAFPALTVRLVLLIRRKPAHFVLDQDPKYGRACYLCLMKALQAGSNSSSPEVIVLSQIQDLADYRTRGAPRRVTRCAWPDRQTSFTKFIETLLPEVKRRA